MKVFVIYIYNMKAFVKVEDEAQNKQQSKKAIAKHERIKACWKNIVKVSLENISALGLVREFYESNS